MGRKAESPMTAPHPERGRAMPTTILSLAAGAGAGAGAGVPEGAAASLEKPGMMVIRTTRQMTSGKAYFLIFFNIDAPPVIPQRAPLVFRSGVLHAHHLP